MQRIIGILLFLTLMVLPTGNSHAAEYKKAGVVAVNSEQTDNTVEIGIESLADRLHNCCFEQPQNAHTLLSRQGKQQPTNRRINDSNKAWEPLCQQQSTRHHTIYSVVCHMAIATSRHMRGYYIYALRHIII